LGDRPLTLATSNITALTGPDRGLHEIERVRKHMLDSSPALGSRHRYRTPSPPNVFGSDGSTKQGVAIVDFPGPDLLYVP